MEKDHAGVFAEVTCLCGHSATVQIPPEHQQETPAATTRAAQERWAQHPCYACRQLYHRSQGRWQKR